MAARPDGHCCLPFRTSRGVSCRQVPAHPWTDGGNSGHCRPAAASAQESSFQAHSGRQWWSRSWSQGNSRGEGQIRRSQGPCCRGEEAGLPHRCPSAGSQCATGLQWGGHGWAPWQWWHHPLQGQEDLPSAEPQPPSDHPCPKLLPRSALQGTSPASVTSPIFLLVGGLRREPEGSESCLSSW